MSNFDNSNELFAQKIISKLGENIHNQSNKKSLSDILENLLHMTQQTEMIKQSSHEAVVMQNQSITELAKAIQALADSISRLASSVDKQSER